MEERFPRWKEGERGWQSGKLGRVLVDHTLAAGAILKTADLIKGKISIGHSSIYIWTYPFWTLVTFILKSE